MARRDREQELTEEEDLRIEKGKKKRRAWKEDQRRRDSTEEQPSPHEQWSEPRAKR